MEIQGETKVQKKNNKDNNSRVQGQITMIERLT